MTMTTPPAVLVGPAPTVRVSLAVLRVFATLRWAATLLLASSLLLPAGCGGSQGRDPKTAEQEKNSRPTKLTHEACEVESAQQKLDANGDGRPEVSIVMKGAQPLCQAVDLNQDGITDVYVYFDASGAVRRREYAYGRDARINEIRIYAAGVLTEIHQSTAAAGKLDTWQYYERGRRVRAERDSNGDGVVDQWWEYKSQDPKCPTMYSDEDGDAKPDPGSEVNLCSPAGANQPPPPPVPENENSPENEKSDDSGGDSSGALPDADEPAAGEESTGGAEAEGEGDGK